MWFHESIYKLLPAAYVMMGYVAAMFLPRSIASFLGGILFTIVGIVVYSMRVKNK